LLACLLLVSGSSFAAIASKPGAYEVSREPFKLGREIHVTYVRPTQPAHGGYLVMFVTGDGGWRSVSSDVFAHLADEGYWLAGFSAPEIIKPIKRMGVRASTAQAAERVKGAFAEARHELGLEDSTPVIVIGFSRGATFVAFAALHPEVRDGVAGAVAIALTREADYLRAPPAERSPDIEVDDKGRIQIYPALKLLGTTPLAVIQSTNDDYVPAAESRELLGPDTPTLRLYTVEAKNHGFSGGRDALLHDLDDALSWIEHARH
jgi:pimeloyl-ACP methyl ester carboxylesterase